jgi:hypothetical protein
MRVGAPRVAKRQSEMRIAESSDRVGRSCVEDRAPKDGARIGRRWWTPGPARVREHTR